MVPCVADYHDGAICRYAVQMAFNVTGVNVAGASDVAFVPFARLSHVEHDQIVAEI